MSDLDIIRQIEDQIKVPLRKMTRQELTKDTWRHLRTYCTDENDNVTGLYIYSMGFSDGELISRLEHLETLILRHNKFESLEFLIQPPKLKELFFTDNKHTDFSLLSEIKGLKSLELHGQKNILDYDFFTILRG